jgi:hypothetical protein
MKTRAIPTLLLISLFSLSAWAHHAAEGIISDDIWQMVDGLLEEADSPHLTLDFDEVMGSMAVASGDNGRPLLVTSIVVRDEDVDDYLVVIESVADEVNRVPSGTTSSERAEILTVETVELDGGLTEILLTEPIGSGQSQGGSAAPGQRKGG